VSEQAIPHRLSDGALLYLFADEIVPRSSFPFTGVKVPCRRAKINRHELTSIVLAVTFWSLRERGHVSIEQDQRKVHNLAPWLSRNCFVYVLDASKLPGIAGELKSAIMQLSLRTQQAASEPVDVRSAIYAWFGTSRGGKVRDPEHHAIERVGKELVKEGYAREHTKLRKGISWLGYFIVSSPSWLSPSFAPRCDAIARARPSFERLADAWRSFCSTEEKLAQALIDECSWVIHDITPPVSVEG
jgi:hypothetical protein